MTFLFQFVCITFGLTRIYRSRKKFEVQFNAISGPEVRNNNTVAKNRDVASSGLLVVTAIFVGTSTYISIFHRDKLTSLNFAFELFSAFIIAPLIGFVVKKDLREFTLEFYNLK